MKSIFQILSFLLFLTIISCSSVATNYNRKKIENLENKGYQIYFNGQKIKSDNFHISKQKLKSVKKNYETKTFEILPNAKANIIDGEDLIREFKYSTKNYQLLILNGIPFIKDNLKNVLIDKNSIKEVTILKKEQANNLFDRKFEEDIIIVKTKN